MISKEIEKILSNVLNKNNENNENNENNNSIVSQQEQSKNNLNEKSVIYNSETKSETKDIKDIGIQDIEDISSFLTDNVETNLLVIKTFYNVLNNAIEKSEINNEKIIFGDNEYDIYNIKNDLNSLIILFSIYQIFQDNETANRCVFNTSINLYDTIDILSGEVCTIETAKKIGIFGKDKYFNTLISKNDVENTDIFINNKSLNKNYSLCQIDNNIAYQNCVLTTENPWKTLSDDKQYCMLPTNIKLPDGLEYDLNKKNIKKPIKIPKFKNKKDYCQTRWYDWFTIPDYHLGNDYQQYINNKNTNEYKCFNPCAIGTISVIKNNNPNDIVNYKCILRDKFQYGYYAKTFYYLPIPLILLLGSTKETILKKHNLLLELQKSALNNITIDNELFQNIKDSKTQDKIYENIKYSIKLAIENLFKLPFDENNIIPPASHIQSISNNLMTKDRIEDAYEIAKKYYLLENGDNEEEFIKWKEQLSDISGFDIYSPKFYKQLLILKKACNVAFDNNSQYSKDIILYNLNYNSEAKPPINFEIKSKDVILSISNNSAENNEINNKDLDKQKYFIQQEIEKRKLIENKVKDSKLKVLLADRSKDISKYSQTKLEETTTTCSNKKKELNIIKFMIMFFIIFVLSVFFIFLLGLILAILWKPVTEILNSIILATYFIIYYIADLFKGKYKPYTFDRDVVQKQLDFLYKKILADKARNIRF